MPSLVSCTLENRGVLAISGPDSRSFLQGLITNDIEKVSETTAIYSAFLTPQGKYLFDFFISQLGENLLIDCERDRIGEFMKRLRIYKLRADAEVVDRSNDLSVMAVWGDNAANAAGLDPAPGSAKTTDTGTLYVDPRLTDAGLRAIVPADANAINGLEADTVNAAAYDDFRLSLGLPQSSHDLIVDKSILLESGLDDLHSIDWQKGCYMGQEVTARSKYRGLVKKRLMPVKIDGPLPAAGSIIMAGDKQAGEMRSGSGDQGIALMRLSYLDEHETFSVADMPSTTLKPYKPDWVDF